MGLDQHHLERLLGQRQLILSHHLTREWLWSSQEAVTILTHTHIPPCKCSGSEEQLSAACSLRKAVTSGMEGGSESLRRRERQGIGYYCTRFLQQNTDIYYPYSLDTPNSFSVAAYYLISFYCLEHSNDDIISV